MVLISPRKSYRHPLPPPCRLELVPSAEPAPPRAATSLARPPTPPCGTPSGQPRAAAVFGIAQLQRLAQQHQRNQQHHAQQHLRNQQHHAQQHLCNQQHMADEVRVALLLEAAEEINKARRSEKQKPVLELRPKGPSWALRPTPPPDPPPAKVRRSGVADALLEELNLPPALPPALNAFKGVEGYLSEDEEGEDDGGKGHDKGYGGKGYYDDKGCDGGKGSNEGYGRGSNKGYGGGTGSDKGYDGGTGSEKGYDEYGYYDDRGYYGGKGYGCKGRNKGYRGKSYDGGTGSDGGNRRGKGYDKWHKPSYYAEGRNGPYDYDEGGHHKGSYEHGKGYYDDTGHYGDKGYYADDGKGYYDDNGYYADDGKGHYGDKGYYDDRGHYDEDGGKGYKGHDDDGGKGYKGHYKGGGKDKGDDEDGGKKSRGGRHVRLAKALAKKEMQEGGLQELMSERSKREYIEWSKRTHWRVWAAAAI